MTERPLRELLRALPAASPAPHFTRRVLARLDDAERARADAAAARGAARRRRRAWLPLAAPAAAVLALLLGLWGVTAGLEAARTARRAELRRESAALRRELDALRSEASRQAQPLYLGGSEQVDVVLDVGALPVAAPVAGGAPPAPRRGAP